MPGLPVPLAAQQTLTLTVQASTATTASLGALKVKLLTAWAPTTAGASLVRQVRIVRSGSTTVGGTLGKLVRKVVSAATALLGGLTQGATPAVVTVVSTEATYVQVTDGPL